MICKTSCWPKFSTSVYYHRCTKLLTSTLFLALIACQKPTSLIEACNFDPLSLPDTLLVTGYYIPQHCRQFLDLCFTSTGELLHDDTAEPTDCDERTTPIQITTFRFPVPDTSDLYGLRIALHQYTLSQPYHFTTNGFQLTIPDHLKTDSLTPIHLYTFATPGKQVLQSFYEETTWQQLLASTEKLEFTFQLIRGASTPCPTPRAPCSKPTFTLLQGTYNPVTGLTTQYHNITASPYDNITISPHTPELQFHLIDSLHVLRIRSIYHLLTEDFAIWSEETDCRHLQNWDLQFIPATGYNLLEIKIDPPFLECLRVGEEGFKFRLALLR